MSRIDELINELCPNGVEYKNLGELTSIITKGTTPTSIGYTFENTGINFIKIESLDMNGNFDKSKFAYISNECHDKLERSKLQENDILFSIAGAIGRIAIVNKDILPANTNQALAIIRLNSPDVLVKYVAYALKTKEAEEKYMSKKVGAAQPNVSLKNISELRIAVPPMEVQNEIVHILDDFTLLSAELSAELKARQKQYEYYRNKLFEDVKDKSKIMMVQELSNNISSGGTPLTTNQSFYKGDIPWLRTQEVNFDEIWDTEIKITEEAIAKSSAKIIPENCVIVAMYGATVGKVAINKIKLSTNQACCNIEVNQDIIDYKYLFYWLSEQYQYIKSLGQGSQTNINAKIVKELKVPVPSLDEQKKIVNILSKFQKITQDILEGLPAEIEARQKQYNYYRDKLLNFKKMED